MTWRTDAGKTHTDQTQVAAEDTTKFLDSPAQDPAAGTAGDNGTAETHTGRVRVQRNVEDTQRAVWSTSWASMASDQHMTQSAEEVKWSG